MPSISHMLDSQCNNRIPFALVFKSPSSLFVDLLCCLFSGVGWGVHESSLVSLKKRRNQFFPPCSIENTASLENRTRRLTKCFLPVVLARDNSQSSAVSFACAHVSMLACS